MFASVTEAILSLARMKQSQPYTYSFAWVRTHTHTPPRAHAQVQIRAPAFSCVKKRCAVNPDCCRATLSPLFSPSFCAAPLYRSLSSHLSSLKRSDIAVSRLFRLALFFSFSTLLLKERICHLSASLHFLSLPRRS